MTKAQTTVDLTNCDREPIHIPGTIQSHGVLLACDVDAVHVLRHSEDAGARIGWPHADLNGRELVEVVGADVAHDIRNALSSSVEPSRPGLVFGRRLPSGETFDIAAHSFHGSVVLEFEPARSHSEGSPLEVARALVSRMRRAGSESELIRNTARLMRSFLGYDRVMVYRFAHDGSGRVVTEARRSGLESFLGQHFPAADIPQQARKLYLQNAIRIIPDAEGARVPIVPERDASGEPLDLSFAHLRSVSPVHCEYLRNMGVRASMSVSIIVEGELWGLIACHHYAPRALTMAQRVAAEMFGEFFSLHLEALLHQGKLQNARRARASLDSVLREIAQETDLHQALAGRLDAFARLLPNDGVALFFERTWTPKGVTPPPEAAAEIARFVGATGEGHVYATHALSQRIPAAVAYKADVSGVLAIPLSQRPRDYLFFFRRELVRTIDWAGDPNKQYESGPSGDRLTPRKSFAIWEQTVEAQSTPWTEADREMAEAARMALVEIVLRHSELLQEERSKADVRQRLLNEELNHRVKNILSLIKSLVSQPNLQARSLADYVESLKGRIRALSNAHDQIVRGAGGGALHALLSAEVSPYRSSADKITLGGPDILLDARAFSVMALVLHELATNAAKYGALSVAAGRLSVTWANVPGGCEITWRETGKPIARPPVRTGFGTALIERSIPHDLGGQADVAYLPDGLQARFFVPARHLAAGAVDPLPTLDPVEEDLPRAPDGDAFANLDLLLVEDQMLIAMDAETLLMDGGARQVETANTVADALRRLQTFTPDAAILDLNLGSDLSLPVAARLQELGVPFVFATGYGDTPLIPATLASVPIVRKPYDHEDLAKAVRSALRSLRHAS